MGNPIPRVCSSACLDLLHLVTAEGQGRGDRRSGLQQPHSGSARVEFPLRLGWWCLLQNKVGLPLQCRVQPVPGGGPCGHLLLLKFKPSLSFLSSWGPLQAGSLVPLGARGLGRVPGVPEEAVPQGSPVVLVLAPPASLLPLSLAVSGTCPDLQAVLRLRLSVVCGNT